MLPSPDNNWPLDYTAEWNRRGRMRNRLLDNPEGQALLKQHYKKNFKAWLKDWGITFDPRRKGQRLMPFILFPRQEEFADFLQQCYFDKENGQCEKSRDMGATWICCAFSVWLWLFHPGSVIGWGSRKAEYVDKKGDPKTIFTKIRQQLAYLPKWMMPRAWNKHIHDNHMRIVNPDNDSAITGEAGDNMGRGGRTSIYFKDESAHYEHPELVEAALGDNTDVQIDISSVNGPGTIFYRRTISGVVWYPDIPIERGATRIFILDWRDHPAKTQEWHDLREEKARREGLLHIFRQEVDRDSLGSKDRQVISAEWVRAAIDAHKVLKFEPTGEMRAGQDVADGGIDKNALVIAHGVVVQYMKGWGGEADEAARIAVPVCIQKGVKLLSYDTIGVGAGFRAGAKHIAVPKGMKIVPWNAGGSVLDAEKHIIKDDRESAKNKDQYENLKAQSWFRTRTRFWKTYRMVKHGEVFPFDELISIDSSLVPNYNEIVVQLAQAEYGISKSGKTIIDKNPEGVASPNLADALVICINPDRPPAGFFDV